MTAAAAVTTAACPSCGHRRHTEPCKRLGPVECRRVPRGDGVAILRGRWPCGCTHGATQDQAAAAGKEG